MTATISHQNLAGHGAARAHSTGRPAATPNRLLEPAALPQVDAVLLGDVRPASADTNAGVRSPWSMLPTPTDSPVGTVATPSPSATLDPCFIAVVSDESTPRSLQHRLGLELALALSLAGTVTLAGCSAPPATSQAASDSKSLELVNERNPVLHGRAAEVSEVDATVRQTLADMERTMHDHGGVGLAAPQVGIPLRLIVVDAGGGRVKLVNPTVEKRAGDVRSTEGCLSLPGKRYIVHRSETVTVKGLDENGAPVTIEAGGLKARALQHEIDHLDGFTIADRAAGR